MKDDDSDYLTPAEAAVVLRRFRADGTPSVDSIRALIKRRIIPCLHIGRAVLISRSSIDRVLSGELPRRRGRPKKKA